MVRNIYLLQAGAHRWSNDADNSWGNKGQPNQDLIHPKKIPTKIEYLCLFCGDVQMCFVEDM